MKANMIIPAIIISTVCALLLTAGAFSAKAADGTWTNDLDGVWSDTANWLDAVVADGAGSTAYFSNDLGSTVTVNLDSAKTIGNLQFVQGTYAITNNSADAVNILTLAGPSKPVISIPANNTATIRRTVTAGADGFILDGGGTLNLYKSGAEPTYPLDPANTWTGDVVLNNGTLQIQTDDVTNDGYAAAVDLALDGLTSFTFYNGSTLNLRPDASTTPGYGTMDANLIVPQEQTGNLILPVRFSGSSGDGGAIGTGLGGTLTGSGTLNVLPKYIRGNVVGDWSAFTGQINIAPNSATGGGDEFRFGSAAGFPDASVDLGGSVSFTFRHYPSIAADTAFPIGLLSGDNATAYVAGSATAAYTLFYDVGAKQTNPTETTYFAGSFVNGAGPAGIIWNGAGTWVLTGNSTHTGGNTINSGVLQIGDGFSETGLLGTGPITNLGALVISRGGVATFPNFITGSGSLTVSGFSGRISLTGASDYSGPTVVTAGHLEVGTLSEASGPYTIADGAVLGFRVMEAGNTVTISSAAFGTACSLEYELVDFGNPTATVVTSTGAINLAGDVTVNVAGSGLGVGTITLLEYGSRSGAGNFVIGTIPGGVTGYTFNDDKANKRVTLTINAVFDPTLRWEGVSGSDWDIGNAANLVWEVVGNGQPASYDDGDAVRFDDLASGSTSINVAAYVTPSTMVVDNSTLDFTFNGIGSLNGPLTIVKRGDGMVTFNTVSYTTGGAFIDAGTVRIGDGTTAAAIGTGNITNNGALVFSSVADNTLDGTSIISGSGVVVQEGPGALTLSGANTHTGGVMVKTNATLNNGNGSAVGGTGATLTLDGGNVQLNADISSGRQVIVLNDSTVTTVGTTARRIDSPIYGTNVNLNLNNNALLTFYENINGFHGAFNLASQNSGVLRFNAGGANTCTGSTNSVYNFMPMEGTTNWLVSRNAGTFNLGAVSGGPGVLDQQGSGSGTVTWSVGALNTNTTFTGRFQDAASTRTTAITKVGTGTWTLNDVAFVNKGALTVSNGVLAFVGDTAISSSNSAVVVASPGVLDLSGATSPTLQLGGETTTQTLRGDGAIVGSVLMGANGRLEPGFSIGTITVSDGTVTLGGTTVMELTTTPAADSDKLVAPSIAYGGTLILTNIGDLTGERVFQLFNGALSGAFANVVTPDLAGVTWDFSQLNVNGTVSIVGPPPVDPTPTDLAVVFNGSQLTLSWPTSHLGWDIQTNSVGLHAPDAWVTIPGSEGVNQLILDIDTSKTNVFYRMHYLLP